MIIIPDIVSLRQQIDAWKKNGECVALVPTMGNLHQGHLQLVQHAGTLAAHTVVSVFVNPLQFDRQDDLSAYPRTLEHDTQLLNELNIDILFCPSSYAIYPQALDEMTRVEVPGLTDILCGANRPGHFAGVATVVTKLFNLVQPNVAVFGEKDYQQLLLIKKLVADLNLPVVIDSLQTVREHDGLAMSSRNRYLTAEQRQSAPLLYATLQRVVNSVRTGDEEFSSLERGAEQALAASGFKPDYVSIRDANTLNVPDGKTTNRIVLAAAWLGNARLIDNISIAP